MCILELKRFVQISKNVVMPEFLTNIQDMSIPISGNKADLVRANSFTIAKGISFLSFRHL